jgi:hypothetical protein
MPPSARKAPPQEPAEEQLDAIVRPQAPKLSEEEEARVLRLLDDADGILIGSDAARRAAAAAGVDLTDPEAAASVRHIPLPGLGYCPSVADIDALQSISRRLTDSTGGGIVSGASSTVSRLDEDTSSIVTRSTVRTDPATYASVPHLGSRYTARGYRDYARELRDDRIHQERAAALDAAIDRVSCGRRVTAASGVRDDDFSPVFAPDLPTKDDMGALLAEARMSTLLSKASTDAEAAADGRIASLLLALRPTAEALAESRQILLDAAAPVAAPPSCRSETSSTSLGSSGPGSRPQSRERMPTATVPRPPRDAAARLTELPPL